MSNDRGMVKWMPYKSLVDQATSLAKMRYLKNKKEKPLLSSDAAEEIDEILQNYHGEKLEARYWEDGYIYQIEGVLLKIDLIQRILVFAEKKIPVRNLLGLSVLD